MLRPNMSKKTDINRGSVPKDHQQEMTYGESNVTCPTTSRDVKWSRLSHIFVINSRNKGYNHMPIIIRRFAFYYSVLQPKYIKWPAKLRRPYI